MNFELTVSDIYKSYRTIAGSEFEVLRGVSFTVESGELVAITGASGAGKSTLLHLIGGLETADKGSIKLDALEISHASQTSLAEFHRNKVAFVFQFHHLLSDLSAAENVALPVLINRKPKHLAIEQAKASLNELGLGNLADHPVTQLSGGEQQRVALARALINKPQLVLADEPTGNLDTAMGDEIDSLLASYCKQNQASVIIATHNQRIASTCDRILYLHDGKIS